MTDNNGAAELPTRKKALIWAAAIVGFLALTWGTMLYNDYTRVIKQYLKPAFCINFDPAYQEYRSLKWWLDETEVLLERKISERYIIDYGYFQGLGYSVELSGAFLPFNELPPRDPKTLDILNPWPGVLQARFWLFGKEIGRVDRPYPPEAGRTADWQLKEIL